MILLKETTRASEDTGPALMKVGEDVCFLFQPVESYGWQANPRYTLTSRFLCMREVGVGRRHASTAWPGGRAGRSPCARGSNAGAQLPRLSDELFELLKGGGPVRNAAMGGRRENRCHPSTPQLEGV